MSTPSIIRVARRDLPYTQIARATAQDPRLSLEARGLLCYLLSLPDHWEARAGQLCDRLGVGRDKLQRIMRELEDAGYLLRKRLRDPLSGAWLGQRTMIYETPQAASSDDGEAAESEETEDVSSENDDAETQENDPVSIGVASPPQPENPVVAVGVTSPPQPENPADGFSGSGRDIKDLRYIPPYSPPSVSAAPAPLRTESPAEKEFWTQEVAADWERLMALWPLADVGDVERSKRAFGRMSDSDRALAVKHAGDHLRDCARGQRKPGSLRSYCAARLFAPWASGEKTHPREPIFVIEGTPAFDAWANRWRRENGRPAFARPFTIERVVDGVRRRGMLRDTLFPPKSQPCASAAAGDADAREHPPPGDGEGPIEIVL